MAAMLVNRVEPEYPRFFYRGAHFRHRAFARHHREGRERNECRAEIKKAPRNFAAPSKLNHG